MSSLNLSEYPQPCIVDLWKHSEVNKEDRARLKKYSDKYCNGKVEVEYRMKYKYGRLYCVSDFMSCINMPKKIRKVLFGETEYDIDIVNCHNSILLALAENITIPTENLRYYCENRQIVFNAIKINVESSAVDCDCDQDEAKKLLFTILLYGGSVETWANKLEFKESDYSLPQFVYDYIHEIKLIAEVLTSKYTEIATEVYNKQCEKEIDKIKTRNSNKKDKRKKDEVFDATKFKVSAFKTLSIILQDYERKIILHSFEYLKANGVVITSYNYDGFQVLKKSFDTSLLVKLNQNTTEKYVVFKIKEFTGDLDVSSIPIEKNFINYPDFELYEDVQDGKCEYFNKFFVQTKKPPVYNILDHKGNIINQLTQCKLTESYAEYNLLDGYISNKNKFVKERLVYLPPPLKARECDYNSWRGFAIEDVPPSESNCDSIYTHIFEMSGNDKSVYEYLLNWIAHLLQFPSKKTGVCIILYSREQGTGKSCLAEILFQIILGAEKIFITGNVDKLFGRFSNVAGKHLVVLNEASGKDTKNIHEIIKDCITREVMMVEKKGIDAYEMPDFANYILTTNNISCVDIKNQDRRFMPISVGTQFKGNVEYFKRLRKDLADENIMRKFYDDSLSRDLSNWNPESIPITQLKSDIISTCISPYEEFYTWYTEEEVYKNQRVIKPIEFYKIFKMFWIEVGRHGFCPSNTKFGVEMKTVKGITFKKSSAGNVYCIS